MGNKKNWYKEDGRFFSADGSEIISKVCIKCQKEKKLSEFTKDIRRKCEVAGECKTCASIRKGKYRKEYAVENRDKILSMKKEYRENNREILSEKQREYRKRNKSEIAKRQKEYIKTKEGAETLIRARRKRKALELKNGGSYTSTQWEECKQFFNNKCAYSGQPLRTDNIQAEHIIPLSKGGTSYIWNLCISLGEINHSKYNNNMEKWYRKQEYFIEERLQKIYEWQDYAYNKYRMEYDSELEEELVNE